MMLAENGGHTDVARRLTQAAYVPMEAVPVHPVLCSGLVARFSVCDRVFVVVVAAAAAAAATASGTLSRA